MNTFLTLLLNGISLGAIYALIALGFAVIFKASEVVSFMHGSLLLFGGDTLKDFAFALLVGVASGAYSSIFIATPVLVEWKEREAIYMRRRRLVMEENGGIVPPFASETIGESPEEAGLEPRERRAARRAQRKRAPARPPGETGTAATAGTTGAGAPTSASPAPDMLEG